ncbi:MAG: hypothetical protein H8E31_09065, partial [Planctomycetes bacterium]|nr:hypothetical protein [Planctomycetota bacterium]
MTRNNKVPLLLGFGGLALVSLIALPSPKNDEAPPMQLGSFAPPATPPGASATALPA